MFVVGVGSSVISVAAGENLTLKCNITVTSASVDWWLHRPGVRPLRFCYDGEVHRPENLPDKYSLKTVPGSGYNLTIINLADDDSGTYICKSNKEERIFSVNVTSRLTTTSSTTTQDSVTGSLTLSASSFIPFLLQYLHFI